MTALPKPTRRVKAPRPLRRTAIKPARKRWCMACRVRGLVFRVDKSEHGPGYWAHEGCGAKTFPRRPVRKKGKRANLRKRANELWSQIVKAQGLCYFAGMLMEAEIHECAGSLQAAHGLGKKAHPSVRYLPINGFPLCARAHTYYTWQPHRWERVLREAWGPEVYEELYRLGCQTVRHDLPAIIAKLREELAR